MKKNLTLDLFFVVALCIGCASGRIKPGHARASVSGVTAEAFQPQDPKEEMTQTVTVTTESEAVDAEIPTQRRPISSRSKRVVETKIGAAQKNAAQEIAAKLASVRWLQWLGVLVAGFGVASLAYPPLSLLVGSVTTSVWCIGSGAALIFLPLLVVGHEVMIAGVCCGAAGLWWLAHHHGAVSAELKILKGKL